MDRSHYGLRRLLGQLGIFLPWTLLVVNCFVFKSSISHYFYTQAGTVFTGFMISFGLFLFTYKGYEKDPAKNEWFSDNWVTNFAGVLAILTALIPTAFGKDYEKECVNVLCHNCFWVGAIHLTCAAGFLFIMGGISIFKFRLGPKKDANLWRHPLYLACGLIVWLSLAFIGIYLAIKSKNPDIFSNGVFWGETVGVTFFGISWLVKGRVEEMTLVRKVRSLF